MCDCISRAAGDFPVQRPLDPPEHLFGELLRIGILPPYLGTDVRQFAPTARPRELVGAPRGEDILEAKAGDDIGLQSLHYVFDEVGREPERSLECTADLKIHSGHHRS